MKILFPGVLLFVGVFAHGAHGDGLPNPSSEWCDQNGGTLENYQGRQGALGVCRLDRALVEEWTLYRATAQHAQTRATQAFLAHAPLLPTQPGPGVGMPNPASVYCGQVGGRLEVLNSPLGETGFCKFSDRSLIEEWTLFGGPQAEGHEKLAELLGRD